MLYRDWADSIKDKVLFDSERVKWHQSAQKKKTEGSKAGHPVTRIKSSLFHLTVKALHNTGMHTKTVSQTAAGLGTLLLESRAVFFM